MSTLVIRLLRVMTFLALVVGSLVGGAGRVAAQGLEDDTYTDDVAGWSLQFDDRFWEAEELADDGVTGLGLNSDLGYVSLRVYEDGITDAGDCLADLERFYTTDSRSWDDLEEADRVDPPETDRSAESALYEGTFTAGTDEFDAVLYLECREVEDATLAIDAGSAATTYEDFVPELETVLADLEIEGGAGRDDEETPDPDDEETPDPDDEETPEPDDREALENDPDAGEIDDNTFTDTNFGYSVTWDEDLWEGELLTGGTLAGVVISTVEGEDFFISIVVDASVGYEGVEPEECVENLADGFADFEGYSPLDEAPRVEGPEPPRDGAGAVYRFTFTGEDGDELELVAYIECRPVTDDVMVRTSVQTTEAALEDNVDAVQDVLDGFDIEAAADPDEETPDPDEEETPDPDEEETPEPDGPAENDPDAGELDDDTFTDTALGYTVTFDDRAWEAELIDGGTTAGIFLTSTDEDLIATVTLDASVGYDGVDADECAANIAAGYEDFEGYSSLEEIDFRGGPEPPRDGAAFVYEYTITFSDGSEAELVAYVECRPIDDDTMIRTTIQTTADALEADADLFQELLDGIEIDGGGSSSDDPGGSDDPDDEETPDPDDEDDPLGPGGADEQEA